jgi:hypothetical protein
MFNVKGRRCALILQPIYIVLLLQVHAYCCCSTSVLVPLPRHHLHADPQDTTCIIMRMLAAALMRS